MAHLKAAMIGSQVHSLAETGLMKAGPALPVVRKRPTSFKSSLLRGSGGGGIGVGGGGGGGVGGGFGFGAPPAYLAAAARLSEAVLEFLSSLSLTRQCADLVVKLGIDDPDDFALFNKKELLSKGFSAVAVKKIRNGLKDRGVL
jgi:hypothetical protein